MTDCRDNAPDPPNFCGEEKDCEKRQADVSKLVNQDKLVSKKNFGGIPYRMIVTLHNSPVRDISISQCFE